NNATVDALTGTADTLTETFAYVITDGNGNTASANIIINIAGTDDPSVAVDDTSNVTEQTGTATTSVTFNSAAGLLANDSDPDDTLTVKASSVGTFADDYGTFTITSSGAWSYSLDDNNATVDALTGTADTLTETFAYVITDGSGGKDTANIIITIAGTDDPPVAVDDTAGITEQTGTATTSVAFTSTVGLLANDSDPDDSLSVTTTGTFTDSYGTFTITSAGAWSYSLDDNNATVDALTGTADTLTETFAYVITDGSGGKDTANIIITIAGTDDPPVAVDDTAGITELADNTAINSISMTTATGLLANDSDPDDTLTVTSTGTFTGDYGTLFVNADGSYSYRLINTNTLVNALNTGETLTDAFAYTITDGATTDVANVTIIINGVNDSPTAVDDTATVTELVDSIASNSISMTTATGLLANDIDPEDNLSVTSTGTFTGDYGTLSVNSDGSYSYSLDNTNTLVNALDAGENLSDTFTYTITDGAISDTAQVKIIINGVNDSPVAVGDSSSVTELKDTTTGNTATGTATLIANDSDPEGDAMTVTTTGTMTGTYGDLSIDGAGNYSYSLDNSNSTVNALDTGDAVTETFTYVLSDGNGNTDSATITITINGADDDIVSITDPSDENIAPISTSVIPVGPTNALSHSQLASNRFWFFNDSMQLNPDLIFFEDDTENLHFFSTDPGSEVADFDDGIYWPTEDTINRLLEEEFLNDDEDDDEEDDDEEDDQTYFQNDTEKHVESDLMKRFPVIVKVLAFLNMFI
ncbi:MAG: VCBS domain-containing protein, partial [Lentisphaeria bacterium]|nr:VCBS domain-containing protein [Lentisphaeria bacterium]